jgi:hypothetical protein
MHGPALTYILLLSLYHGRASVVELLSAGARAQLRVDTRVFAYLERFAADESPRHLFLTGNAGDGKTFAALTALPAPGPGLHVVHDASAVWSSGHDPISALAAQLSAALGRGERLLVAINRGQLERLVQHVASWGADDALPQLLRAALSQLRLEVSWDAAVSAQVAVIDLGLWDTLHGDVLEPLLERLATAQADVQLAAPTAAAFEAAKRALADPNIRARVKLSLQATRALGQHTTMRQLWAALAYIMTGGRAPDDATPLGPRDAVGARLFEEDAQSELFERLRAVFDPALSPQPALAIDLLAGRLPATLSAAVGVEGLLTQPTGEGQRLARIAWTHGRDGMGEINPPEDSSFDLHVKHLRTREPGWHSLSTSAQSLLRGAYKRANLWSEGEDFPAWQRLCYDAGRIEGAAAVAAGAVEVERLEFGLPRPAPAAAEALGDAWRPPYLWVRYGEGGAQLRLEPHMLNVLRGEGGALTKTEQTLLSRWLATLTSKASGRAGVSIARGPDAKPVQLLRDELTGELTITP